MANLTAIFWTAEPCWVLVKKLSEIKAEDIAFLRYLSFKFCSLFTRADNPDMSNEFNLFSSSNSSWSKLPASMTLGLP